MGHKTHNGGGDLLPPAGPGTSLGQARRVTLLASE
jgi:hypothetical protein